jgi:CMP-N-acetylneuraminic acid synthetase
MITAFLPCRSGSQRVPFKNTRPFAGNSEGLVGIKLDQLIQSPLIDEIVLSTNDPVVIAVGETRLEAAKGRMRIDNRPDHLCSSATLTDEVIAYVPTIITEGTVLWTHVTSPFFDGEDYSIALKAYHDALAAGTHDSLAGATRIQNFLWNENGPVNYDRKVEKWPRTQTFEPLFEINSSIFIAPIEIYRDQADRIGDRPVLYEVSKEKTVDIDWPDDFVIAELLWQARDQKAGRAG